MLKALRVFCALAAIALFITGIVKHRESNIPPPPKANPAHHDRFAEVAYLNVYEKYTHPNRELVREYEAAEEEYNTALANASAKQSEAIEGRDLFMGFALAALIGFLSTCLPWDYIFVRGADAASDAIVPAAKFFRGRFTSDDADIIGHDKLMRYSVADELLKWTDLRDRKIITEAEFEEARRKLLRR